MPPPLLPLQLGVGAILVTVLLWLRERGARRAFARRFAQLLPPADHHWLEGENGSDSHLALLGLPMACIELWAVLVALLPHDGRISILPMA